MTKQNRLAQILQRVANGDDIYGCEMSINNYYETVIIPARIKEVIEEIESWGKSKDCSQYLKNGKWYRVISDETLQSFKQSKGV